MPLGSDEALIFVPPLAIFGAGAMCIATIYMVAQLSRDTRYDFISTPTPIPTATRPPLPTRAPSPTPGPDIDCVQIGPNGSASLANKELSDRNVVPKPRKLLYIDLVSRSIKLPESFKGEEIKEDKLPSKVGPEDYLCYVKLKPQGSIYQNPISNNRDGFNPHGRTVVRINRRH